MKGNKRAAWKDTIDIQNTVSLESARHHQQINHNLDRKNVSRNRVV